MNNDKSKPNEEQTKETVPEQQGELSQAETQQNAYSAQIEGILKQVQDNCCLNTPESQKFFFEIIPTFINSLLNFTT